MSNFDNSIIMITFNRVNMVGNMIQDICNQTMSEFEYLIIDNGSTDDTWDKVKEWEKKDERIKCIRLNSPVSVGAARNFGVRNAVGKNVAFIDDDDRVESDFLESVISLKKDYNADFVMCGSTEQIGGQIIPQVVFDGIEILDPVGAVKELIKRKKIRAGMPGKLIRRDFLTKYPFKEDCRHEDVHTMYRYLASSKRVVLNGTPKYCFVRHGDNLSAFQDDFSLMTADKLNEYLNAYLERRDWLIERFPAERDYWNYSVWSFMLSMCNKIKKSNNNGCMGLYREMSNEIKREIEYVSNCKYLTESEMESLIQIKDGEGTE